MQESTTKTVSIRPGVSILSVLRHISYKPWFAVGEFVDNAIQSFVANEAALKEIEGADWVGTIDITVDNDNGGRLVILDNAAGISQSDFPRAFRPAAIPSDRTGLSEFGMGMKSAASWFADTWEVRTKALGELYEHRVQFDIEKIVLDEIEELEIESTFSSPNAHYTRIELNGLLHSLEGGRTIGAIREHLGSIYRQFLRRDEVRINYNGKSIAFKEVDLLNAPYFRDPQGPSIEWSKSIHFDFGNGLSASGFVGLRQKGSTREAGFSLFRRDRLIQGSHNDTYRPYEIFGSPNSYTYQRLTGEIHLDGFKVSHTKDGFVWDDNEYAFLDLLKDEINSEPLPLLDQAEGHRSKQTSDELFPAARDAVGRTSEDVVERAPEVIQAQVEADVVSDDEAPVTPSLGVVLNQSVDFELNGDVWTVAIELTNYNDAADWLEVTERPSDGGREIGIRISLAHPFMTDFAFRTKKDLEPFVRVGAALALAEQTARISGVKNAGTIRRNLNELLKKVMSHQYGEGD